MSESEGYYKTRCAQRRDKTIMEIKPSGKLGRVDRSTYRIA